jgi:hypothetical protein
VSRDIWYCRGCGRVAESSSDLLAQGCEGAHERFVPASDYYPIRGEAGQALLELERGDPGMAVAILTEVLLHRPARGEEPDVAD